MDNIYFKILLFIFLLIVGYLIYKYYYNQYNLSHTACEIDNFDIDNLMVIKRTPEYSKLINKLIDEKSFIFNDEQIKVLKNTQQIFKVSNDGNEISNISDIVYTNCKNELDDSSFKDYNNENKIIDVSDNEYEKIKNELKNDISKLTEPNCTNVGVLQNNIPFAKNYLKNYYKDLYGNRVEADLADYFTAYYTLINSDENLGFPVNTQIGHSNFIIPDQYNYDSHFTNAYNIDWERIINPIGYSM